MAKKKEQKNRKPAFSKSTRALAIPVTFLMLFVSLSLLISLTYYLAIAKIAAKGAVLNVSAAKQTMFALDGSVNSVAWSPGASRVYYFNDFGGKFHVMPNTKMLTVTVTDSLAFSEIVFNGTVGKASYELQSSEQSYEGLYLRGDTRAVVNQSSATTTQLYIERGVDHALLTLCYRPSASITVTSQGGAKPVNNLRIYIVNLNQSQSATETADFYLQTRCLSTVSVAKAYDFNYTLNTITVNVGFDGVAGSLLLPVSANEDGAILNVEVVVCSIMLEVV